MIGREHYIADQNYNRDKEFKEEKYREMRDYSERLWI